MCSFETKLPRRNKREAQMDTAVLAGQAWGVKGNVIAWGKLFLFCLLFNSGCRESYVFECDIEKDVVEAERMNCGEQSAVDSKENLEGTPRGLPWIERLLVETFGYSTAPNEQYSRLACEIGGIQRENYILDYVPGEWGTRGTSLEIKYDQENYARVQQGSYTEWDCLNAAHGVDVGAAYLIESKREIRIQTEKILNPRTMGEEYSKLPGVVEARAQFGILENSEGSMCLLISGQRYQYLFTRTYDLGTSGIEVWLYESEEAGVVKLVNQHMYSKEKGNEEPGWLKDMKNECGHSN